MSAGRPLTFDPDQALRAAMELFWRQGYEATSLQHLLKATGLSKSSLYQTFGSKQQLFARAFMHYCDWRAGRMLSQLQASSSGWDFIEETFTTVAEGAESALERRGCLLMNTASEFGQRDPAVAKLLMTGMERFTAVFAQAVRQAQAEGQIPAERDAEALARYLVSSMSGLGTLVKAGFSKEQAREVVQAVLRGLNCYVQIEVHSQEKQGSDFSGGRIQADVGA
jgi:TetR/AcrR family transcriptional repressor of nem operon